MLSAAMSATPSRASRSLVLAYGLAVYAFFLVTFLYAVGWVGGLVTPTNVAGGLTAEGVEPWLVNAGLLGLFAVQHTVMARLAFKRWWTRFVPAPVERSTFVLATNLILMLVFFQWRQLDGVVWHVQADWARGLLWTLFALGWGIVLLSTFLIDHFELFGVRQVYDHWRGRVHRPAQFVERSLYRFVRHPLMFGFLLAFWAAPSMSAGRFFFAAVTSAWVLVAVRIEERTLLALHGEAYQDYRRRVSMLVPRPPAE